MEDISNKELQEQMKQGFSKIMKEVIAIHQKQDWIVEHLKYTYNNSRDIHQMVAVLNEQVDKLTAKITAIQNRLPF